MKRRKPGMLWAGIIHAEPASKSKEVFAADAVELPEHSAMRVLDLFSGIGGFSLGLERAGPFETAAFVERDDFCQAVLRKHWPNTPVHDDVRTIDTDGLGDIDLVCGGFPCQPWSVAGKQRGAEDDRDLWPVMAALIEKLRPRWVIGENVRGFVNEPLGLKRSLSDLESIGYQAVPFIVPACAVDAPHRRDRVWIVAHSQPTRTGGASGEAGHEGRASREDRGEGIRQGDRPTGAGRTIAASEDGGRQGWIPEPDVGRVVDGVSRRVDRLKALGNAAVPQVVAQIGRAILAAEND